MPVPPTSISAATITSQAMLMEMRMPVMIVGGTGIGYFVWNEWNNLSITNVMIAILAIGLVGMALDQTLGRIARLVTYPE